MNSSDLQNEAPLPAKRGRSVLVRTLRWLPFAVLSLASLWAANDAPEGRRDPRMDLTLTLEALATALTKLPHIGSTFVIMLAAGLAVGTSRLLTAAVLAFLVSASWEISQTTVVGHNPRLADLLPNAVGIALGWVVLAVVARMKGPRP